MPFDFLDGINFLTDLLSLSFSGSSGHKNDDDSKRSGKKWKSRTLFWSAIFTSIALVTFLTAVGDFKAENNLNILLICSFTGIAVSFVFFYFLYHLGLYYFRNIWLFLFFNISFILMMISIVLLIYIKWMI